MFVTVRLPTVLVSPGRVAMSAYEDTYPFSLVPLVRSPLATVGLRPLV
jgi:hypothetical protein